MSVLRPTIKLTAVTITSGNIRIQEFLMLRYEDGKAVLDTNRLMKLLAKHKVPRQACINVG